MEPQRGVEYRGGAITQSFALPNLHLLLVAQGNVFALVILEF
jgi:hypothetical protein